MIKSIVFDWGGVLIKNPEPDLLKYFAEYFNTNTETYKNHNKKYIDSFQKGKLPEKKYWEKICKDLQVKKPTEKSLWKKAFKTVYQEKKENFSLIKMLRKNGYQIGFLSNTEIPSMNFFLEQRYYMFDVLVFSCKEGYRKPERKIYEITLNRLKTNPEETLFIDDKEEFRRGAEKLGIHTILYKNSQQLKEKLKSFSIKYQ